MLGLVLIYVGSYTPEAGGSGEGVSVWSVDDPARPRPAAPTAVLPAPSFLVAHPGAPVLYAVNELDDGAVTALAVGPGGALTPAGREPTGGSAPCHLAVTADGRHLLCANYGSGSVAVFPLGSGGTLGARSDLVAHQGSGPVPDRQEGPHAHHVSVRGADVTAVDLGTDTLYGYRLEPGGTLTPTWTTGAGAGSGPRHLAVAATGRRYVADELGSTVSVYEPDPAGGLRLTHRRPATLRPPDGDNFPSEIAVSADGRFVYVANRGNDSVSTFEIAGDALAPVDEVATGGVGPRHFAFVGDFMYVANERSHAVTVLDVSSGVPRPAGIRIDVPSPVCVLPVSPSI